MRGLGQERETGAVTVILIETGKGIVIGSAAAGSAIGTGTTVGVFFVVSSWDGIHVDSMFY